MDRVFLTEVLSPSQARAFHVIDKSLDGSGQSPSQTGRVAVRGVLFSVLDIHVDGMADHVIALCCWGHDGPRDDGGGAKRARYVDQHVVFHSSGVNAVHRGLEVAVDSRRIDSGVGSGEVL